MLHCRQVSHCGYRPVLKVEAETDVKGKKLVLRARELGTAINMGSSGVHLRATCLLYAYAIWSAHLETCAAQTKFCTLCCCSWRQTGQCMHNKWGIVLVEKVTVWDEVMQAYVWNTKLFGGTPRVALPFTSISGRQSPGLARQSCPNDNYATPRLNGIGCTSQQHAASTSALYALSGYNPPDKCNGMGDSISCQAGAYRADPHCFCGSPGRPCPKISEWCRAQK